MKKYLKTICIVREENIGQPAFVTVPMHILYILYNTYNICTCNISEFYSYFHTPVIHSLLPLDMAEAKAFANIDLMFSSYVFPLLLVMRPLPC